MYLQQSRCRSDRECKGHVLYRTTASRSAARTVMKDTTEDNQDSAEQQDLQLCPLVGPSRCPVTDILVMGSSWGHQVAVHAFSFILLLAQP